MSVVERILMQRVLTGWEIARLGSEVRADVGDCFGGDQVGRLDGVRV